MLSGFAKNQEEKKTAEAIAARVKGVKAVRNELLIRPWWNWPSLGVQFMGSELVKLIDAIDWIWWRFTDSNRGPVDYDENALEKYYINQRYFSGV